MEKVTRDGVYPIADAFMSPDVSRATTRARWTGEFRAPRKGEWFLSGAIVEAYFAPTDGIKSEYHIARLVQGRMVWDA